MTKTEEIILKWYKTPFDEEEISELLKTETPIKSLTSIALIFGMLEGASLLGRKEELLDILNGTKQLDEDIL